MRTYDESLFNFLETACLAEGGDGDVAFISDHYQDVSEKFDQWLVENNNTWWRKAVTDKYITYCNDQECILFTDKREHINPSTITIVETCFNL